MKKNTMFQKTLIYQNHNNSFKMTKLLLSSVENRKWMPTILHPIGTQLLSALSDFLNWVYGIRHVRPDDSLIFCHRNRVLIYDSQLLKNHHSFHRRSKSFGEVKSIFRR